MLYEAVYWFDDGSEERPALDAMIAEPHNPRYVEVGADRATWRSSRSTAKRRPSAPRGAGTSPPSTRLRVRRRDVPELAIAVYPEFRRTGVGGLLLGSLIARSRATEARGHEPERRAREPGTVLYRVTASSSPETSGTTRPRRCCSTTAILSPASGSFAARRRRREVSPP